LKFELFLSFVSLEYKRVFIILRIERIIVKIIHYYLVHWIIKTHRTMMC